MVIYQICQASVDLGTMSQQRGKLRARDGHVPSFRHRGRKGNPVLPVQCNPALTVTTVDEEGKDVQPMAPRRRGSWVPSLRSALMQPTLIREYLLSGRRPCTQSANVRWQEATDPQSPKGGSQRACHTGGAHPTASGRREGVALMKQPALLGS